MLQGWKKNFALLPDIWLRCCQSGDLLSLENMAVLVFALPRRLVPGASRVWQGTLLDCA